MAKPKAILFDIGGVCVVSPFQAIVDYEANNGIPKDYINFAISRSGPNGAWQRLERGEIKMDESFFRQFAEDLHNPKLWESYHTTFRHKGRKTLTELAGAKATQLGDPVSLKAETSDNTPTPDDEGAPSFGSSGRRKSLKELANPTLIGDPISLKAEKSDGSPMPDDSGAPATQNRSSSSSTPPRQGKTLKELANPTLLGDPISLKAETSQESPTTGERGSKYTSQQKKSDRGASSSSSEPEHKSLKELANRTLIGDPTSLKAETSSSSPLPDDSGAPASPLSPRSSTPPSSSSSAPPLPPVPKIDATALFWDMMARSRTLDPHMFPALQRLRASNRFVVGALSNTVVFPPDHEYSQTPADPTQDLRGQFDVFVASADVGMRKPSRAIYELAVERLDGYDRGRGGDGISAQDVCFLDDIGENLKAARALGMRTIKVTLGRTEGAVRELEEVTGLRLAGERAKL